VNREYQGQANLLLRWASHSFRAWIDGRDCQHGEYNDSSVHGLEQRRFDAWMALRSFGCMILAACGAPLDVSPDQVKRMRECLRFTHPLLHRAAWGFQPGDGQMGIDSVPDPSECECEPCAQLRGRFPFLYVGNDGRCFDSAEIRGKVA